MHPVLFNTSIRKDLARSFGATFVVLVTIAMTMVLIKVLSQTSRGSIDPSDVLIVMWYTVLAQLATIAPLSLFIAIVSCISRMYRDSEMVIWFTAGRGLAGFVAPLLRFAWPILAAIAVLALVAVPWANEQTQSLKDKFENRGDLDRVAPGQFQESASGTRVFFIDKNSNQTTSANNIFIAATENGKQAVTSAKSGKIDIIKDSRFLMLNNGQRLENDLTTGQLKVSDFETYGVQIGNQQAAAKLGATPSSARSTLTLIRQPTAENLGQLSWRLGLILITINFILLALATSTSNPRAGRSTNMVFALFAFLLYYNLLNLGNSWITSGQSSFTKILLCLHGGTFALAFLWVWKLHQGWSWRHLLPRKASA